MEAETRCCSACLAPFDDIINELSMQTDALGIESMTDQQQAFMEMVWNNDIPDRCPECMD